MYRSLLTEPPKRGETVLQVRLLWKLERRQTRKMRLRSDVSRDMPERDRVQRSLEERNGSWIKMMERKVRLI
jgi:hypothetical protein